MTVAMAKTSLGFEAGVVHPLHSLSSFEPPLTPLFHLTCMVGGGASIVKIKGRFIFSIKRYFYLEIFYKL